MRLILKACRGPSCTWTRLQLKNMFVLFVLKLSDEDVAVMLYLSVAKHHLQTSRGPAPLDVLKRALQTEHYVIAFVNHLKTTQIVF